ncbi:hypothetical protein LJB91_00135 [Bacteroidales bacterium OttesenSCG-928-L03]|nr:hypothetical protein [Bacteroidales bacterium OttesenSCG-928-L03]
MAEPCLEIEQDPGTAYDYTAKGNLVAVILNGTVVPPFGLAKDAKPNENASVAQLRGVCDKINYSFPLHIFFA